MAQPNPNLLWQVRGIRSHRSLLSRFGPSRDSSVFIRPAAAAAAFPAAGSGNGESDSLLRPHISFTDLEMLATLALSTGGGSLSPAPAPMELPPPPRRKRSSRTAMSSPPLLAMGRAATAAAEEVAAPPGVVLPRDQSVAEEEAPAAAAAPAPPREVLLEEVVPAAAKLAAAKIAALVETTPRDPVPTAKGQVFPASAAIDLAPAPAAKLTTAARRTSRLIEIAAAAAAMGTGRRRSPRLRAGKTAAPPAAAASASTSASEDSSASPSASEPQVECDEGETYSHDSDFSDSGEDATLSESDLDTSSPSKRVTFTRAQSQQVIARANSKGSSTKDKNAPVMRRRWTSTGSEAVNSASREIDRRQDPNRKLPASARRYTETSSKYIGVSYYKRIKRYETHIWGFKDKSKQIYIGSCSSEEAGARIYDRAYIKFRGNNTPNFPYSDYINEIPQWINLADDVFITMLRNMSRGKSLLWFVPELLTFGCPRATRTKESTFRGVYRINQTTWTAVITVPGFRPQRLGTYATEEDAARCHDRATIKLLGKTKALNFKFEDYTAEMPRWTELSEKAFLNFTRSLGRARLRSKRKLSTETRHERKGKKMKTKP